MKYFHLSMIFFETDCKPEDGLASTETCCSINPLAYTDVPETAGLARSINP